MSVIRQLGKLLETDADGYLINECGWEKIQSPWLELVDDLRNACMNELGDRLQSLYLRGSIPRGQAIPEVSDLDSVAIVQGRITPALEDQIAALEKMLEQQHRFCKKVEIALLTDSEIQNPTFHWRAVIQTQSLCIQGYDLRPELPRFKPGIELVSHAFDLADDITEVQTFLRESSAHHPKFEQRVKGQCGWIARRIVRTGFELVMEKEGSFTRDLYPCYKCFSRHFPEQEPQMRKALELAIQPSSNRGGLLIFLATFGQWLVAEVDRTFGERPRAERRVR
ncbi:hypothetical protein K9N68_04325 [Kovacikia minuta CCNUW1]|uniref:hypothetical protein n=1 Tax=Kovacikia minuta TaxID=2931930 RepID=UPI001CCFB318|nr:hypothetical protein [Kovacikia minuta]UBF27198.1 hypothetical protein K9N68_04325 [Kovacikia minuta CCNUW1]